MEGWKEVGGSLMYALVVGKLIGRREGRFVH